MYDGIVGLGPIESRYGSSMIKELQTQAYTDSRTLGIKLTSTGEQSVMTFGGVMTEVPEDQIQYERMFNGAMWRVYIIGIEMRDIDWKP